jgi:hypothetical protein
VLCQVDDLARFALSDVADHQAEIAIIPYGLVKVEEDLGHEGQVLLQ